MRIGTRLALTLVVPIVGLMVVFAYVDDWRSRARHHQELVREGRTVARTLQLAIEDYFRDRQLDEVRDIIDRVALYERILGLRVFGADGTLIYQSQSLDGYAFLYPEALAAVLRDKRPFEASRAIAEEPAIVIMVPLINPSGVCFGALQILQLGSFIEDEARATRHSIAILTLVMIAAVTAVILLVTRYGVGRPVEELVHRFREVGSGDLSARVPVHSRDEFGRLAQEFNAMCARLASSQRSLLAEQDRRRQAETARRRAERLASLGRLTAGLAHEIGTPLNVISGRAEALQRRVAGNAPLEKHLEIIIAQIDRIVRTMHGMLDFARARESHPHATDLGALALGVVEFLEQRFEQRRIRVTRDLPESFPLVALDADQITQVFLNLCMNAIEAMPDGGSLEISLRGVTRPHADTPDAAPKGFAAVAFADTGHGIDPEEAGRVFDPFFTTKEIGAGAGLGLSISYGIVQEHGGWIDLQSTPGRGTIVTIYLPLAPRDAEIGNPESGQDAGDGRRDAR